MTSSGVLPTARSVLAVCAHPDDESFGLGGILATFAAAGARTSVLCFTRGEASTLGAADGDLRVLRRAELESAAAVLGVDHVDLLDYPDGGLSAVALDELATHVTRTAEAVDADLLLVFDVGGITGHPDHRAATAAAVTSAGAVPRRVLAWVIREDVAEALNDEFHSSFVGRPDAEIHGSMAVDRERQAAAMAQHPSQYTGNPVPVRRIELTGDVEHVRWLREPYPPAIGG